MYCYWYSPRREPSMSRKVYINFCVKVATAKIILLIFLLNVLGKYDILILEKESTHSKVDAPRWFLNVLTDTAYPVCRQDRHFYFRLFLLLRKASNAITRLPKAHNNVNMPMKIERISKAVIHVTSLPMYSGKPVIWCWEATTLSWVLSYGLRHATNISFFSP